jgi:hypothetical protein
MIMGSQLDFIFHKGEADLERIAQATDVAAEEAYGIFDFDTQEAVNMDPDGNSMLLTQCAEVHQ